MVNEQMLLYIHLGAVSTAVLAVLYADRIGFTWMRGTVATLDPVIVNRLHRIVGAALATIIGSGFLLFLPAWKYLLSEPLFLLKMGFVAVLVINSFAIGTLKDIATQQAFNNITQGQKRVLLVSGAASTLSWIGAIGVAFLFFGWLF